MSRVTSAQASMAVRAEREAVVRFIRERCHCGVFDPCTPCNFLADLIVKGEHRESDK